MAREGDRGGSGAPAGEAPCRAPARTAGCQPAVSIHRPFGAGSVELGEVIEVIEDDDLADPGDVVGEILAGEALRDALATLSRLERTVVTLRYGLDTGVARTLADVGKQLGMKPSQVRQLETDAIGKLRASDLGTKVDVA